MCTCFTGVGGKEASLFTAEIFLMYERWSQLRRWKFEVLECNAAPGVPGYKVRKLVQGLHGYMVRSLTLWRAGDSERYRNSVSHISSVGLWIG